MSTNPAATPASERPLQFDHAESGDARTSAPTCSVCKAEIRDAYFAANGEVFCRLCHAAIEARHLGGSGTARFARALALGVLAAAAGAAIYFAVLAITGYNIGLIAVVVGFLVGAAVRKGSDARGGWAYQTLAIALTYLAVGATFSPFIAKEFADKASVSATSVLDSAATPGKQATQPAQATLAESASPAASKARGARSPLAAPGGNADINPFVAVAVVLLVFMATPLLVGFSSVIHLLILGFALFEAWRLNRRVRVTFTGPHAVAAGQAAGA